MRRPNYDDIPEAFRRAMEGEGWNNEEGQEGGNGGGEPPRRPFPTSGEPPWWTNRRVWLVGLLIVLFLSFDWLVTTYTDWLWFTERSYQDVWLTQWGIQGIVFTVAFVVAGAILLGSWHMARRTAERLATPFFAGVSLTAVPGMNLLITGIGLFFSFTFATAARSQWELFLRYIYRTPFDVADPIFDRDVSFYIFELPIYNFLQGWFMPLIVFAFLGVIGIYGLRYLPALQSNRVLSMADVPLPLRRTVAVMGGIFFALWALGYQLSTYDLLYSPRGVVFGASYTDVNASLWALYVQIAAVVVVSVTLFANYFRLLWKPLIAAVAIWFAASILLGNVYPAILQRFVVEPTELSREREFIEYNIEFTRLAFGLDEIEVRNFGDVDNLQFQDLADNEAALRNMRLWDYRPLQQTYAQLQELRPYYQFSFIDIDRYIINGEERQVMLAARELDKSKLPNVTWVNEKLEFTHGYGVVMNPVDRFTPQGRPEFFISNLPPQSNIDLEVTRPEIYFGEKTDDIVFVGSGRAEFSYPDDEQNVRTSYSGKGGVPLGNSLRQLAFAIRFGESNLLFSEYITPETRALYYRQIQDRIRTITPFLGLDRDPYLVITDEGRLVWIQDAYTTSSRFPYSQPIPTNSGLNYIRNSVKITVDAYDGDVNYYLADEEDPIIRAYASAFPTLFKPFSAMPADLQDNVRYPEDLFRIQTNQYLTYHMTDVDTFYNKEDLRAIPQEIFDDEAQLMEPYYVVFRLPGEEETEYLLIQPFTPADKPNMIAWIAARNDPKNYGDLIAYELPRQELVVGPIQIEGFIDQVPEISEQFSLWNQQGSGLIRGNLIVIPLNNSFLYVEPIYLLSETSALPELKRVIVASGEKIVMRENLQEALDALLTNDGAAIIEVPTEDGEGEGNTAVAMPDASAPQPTPAATDDINALIQQANQQFEAAQAAQQAGDWALYGQQLEALSETLRQLDALTAP